MTDKFYIALGQKTAEQIIEPLDNNDLSSGVFKKEEGLKASFGEKIVDVYSVDLSDPQSPEFKEFKQKLLDASRPRRNDYRNSWIGSSMTALLDELENPEGFRVILPADEEKTRLLKSIFKKSLRIETGAFPVKEGKPLNRLTLNFSDNPDELTDDELVELREYCYEIEEGSGWYELDQIVIAAMGPDYYNLYLFAKNAVSARANFAPRTPTTKKGFEAELTRCREALTVNDKKIEGILKEFRGAGNPADAMKVYLLKALPLYQHLNSLSGAVLELSHRIEKAPGGTFDTRDGIEYLWRWFSDDGKNREQLKSEFAELREKVLASLDKLSIRGTASGQVVDKETGKPLDNAVISFPYFPGMSGIVTDSEGKFSIQHFTSGNTPANVYCDGYHTLQIQMTFSENTPQPLKITMTPFNSKEKPSQEPPEINPPFSMSPTLSGHRKSDETGHIRGAVMTPDPKDEKQFWPVKGAVISIKGLDRNGIITHQHDGMFIFPHVPPGNYTLVVRHKDYETQEIEVTVKPGEMDMPGIVLKRKENFLGEFSLLLLFRPGTAKLDKNSKELIRGMIEDIRTQNNSANRDKHVRFVGASNMSDEDLDNHELQKARAETVRRFLIEKVGIPEKQVLVKEYRPHSLLDRDQWPGGHDENSFGIEFQIADYFDIDPTLLSELSEKRSKKE